MTERKYEVGDQAFYHEKESIYRVRVIESESEDEVIKYGLRIIEVKKSDLESHVRVGEVFHCKKIIDSENTWHLSDN